MYNRYVVFFVIDLYCYTEHHVRTHDHTRINVHSIPIDGIDLSTDAPTQEKTKDRAIKSPWAHFEGLGLGDSVPPYLRSKVRVKNLFLSCWDTVSFVREIAAAKSTPISANVIGTEIGATAEAPLIISSFRHTDRVEPDKAPFAEFFGVFLKVPYPPPECHDDEMTCLSFLTRSLFLRKFHTKFT